MNQLNIVEPFIKQSPREARKNQRKLKDALSTIQVILENCKTEEINARISSLEEILEYWRQNKDVFEIEIFNEQPSLHSSFNSVFEEDPDTVVCDIIFPLELVFQEDITEDKHK